ncbi:MAG: hypothetical protein RL648_253 [Verrucomicrobiota bacterium]|jgi:CBS domain-containing protein
MSVTARALLTEKKTPLIHFVRPQQTTYEALQLMAEKDIGAVAVMEGETLRGVLTERDYARKIVLHGKASRHTPVAETMNVHFPKVSPEMTIEDCMRLISERRFRYVAVMEGERLLGMISIGDIVKHIIAHQQASIEHLERYISGF